MTDNRLAMFAQSNLTPDQQVNYLNQQQAANPYVYDDTWAYPKARGADPLRRAADWVGENKDLPAPQFFMDPRALSARNMLHSALNTSANWLDGTKDPSLIGTQEMVSPLGLAGMAGPMSGALRRGGAAAMADNAKGSAPGTVVNSLDMSEAARMARAKEQGFGEQTYYHGTPDKFDEFQTSPHGQFGAGVYASPSKAHASRFGDVMDLKVRGPVATWADVPDDVGKRGFIQQLFQKTTPSQDAAMWARENGFSGFTPEKGGSSAVIFDPRNIRSTQAAFDPAKRDSAMLLAADNAKGSAPGTVVNSTQQQDDGAGADDGIAGILKKYGLYDGAQADQVRPVDPPFLGETPGRPMMPEDMEPPKGFIDTVKPYAQAFGAGAVDPFGMTGRALNALGYEYPARRLTEMRAESPHMADMGSVLGPGGALGKVGGMTLRELAMPLLGMGGQVPMASTLIREAISPFPPYQRAQAGYPKGGAY